MNKLKLLFIVFIISGVFTGYSQEFNSSYLLELQTTQAARSTIPFWFSANNYGRIPKQSGTMLFTSILGDFSNPKSDFQYSYKVGAVANNAKKNTIFIDEFYGDLSYKNWGFTIGVKHDSQIWEGLSSSNGNIAKSTNARSYPGYSVYLKKFVKLPFAQKWLAVKASYGDYFLNDKRTVSKAKLHSKNLFIKSKLSPKMELIAGLNHYAQWAGTSPIHGKQPSGFKNYLRVITGSAGGKDATESDQVNVLGNQLGTYLLQLNYFGKNSNWNLYWSHPFEDRSGRELANYPDGLYGFFMDFKKPSAIISHLLAEFTYTKHQSGSAPHFINEFGPQTARGRDNYFNNGIYQSGWTYFGNMIGSPYFTTNLEDENGITQGIIVGDNRLIAFNLGFKGIIKRISYKAMLSHTTYVGWFEKEYINRPKQFSSLLELNFPKVSSLPLYFSLGAAFDTGTYRPVNFGGFLKLSLNGAF